MPVTIEETAAAYRLILGREPTSQESSAWGHVASLTELRKLFLTSGEFRTQLTMAGAEAAPQKRLPQTIPPIHAEWETDAGNEERLLAYVTRTWTALGLEEPHWSVLSAEAFKAANMARNAASFYASGANDVALIRGILARHSLTPAVLPRAVEYGCGVGRVTPHLAKEFRELVAIDISESHLAMARDVVSASLRRNVRLVLARVPQFGMTEPFDLWFSYIVLQHNPPPVIAMVLRRMFAMLAEGGVAIFQVPTYAPGYAFDVAKYLAAPKSGTIEVHCLHQSVVFRLAEEAGCTPLEVREDEAMGYPWLSNMFVFRKTRTVRPVVPRPQ